MVDERSPIQHALVLRRVDPDQGAARFYSLMIERDLFGTIRLVRNWGRVGTHGRELAEELATEIEAGWRLRRLRGRSGGATGICEQAGNPTRQADCRAGFRNTEEWPDKQRGHR